MKYIKYAPYVIIVGLIVYILSLKKEIEYVSIPSKENSKVIIAPQPIKKVDTVKISSTEYRLVEVKNPVNTTLLEKYEEAKDSIEQLNLYKSAITEREYKEVLEDSVQTITVHSKVIGTLQEQTISYKTNPVIIERKSLKSNINVYLGAFTTIPTNPNTGRAMIRGMDIGGQINIKTNKQIYNVGYTASGTAIIGVSFKLF